MIKLKSPTLWEDATIDQLEELDNIAFFSFVHKIVYEILEDDLGGAVAIIGMEEKPKLSFLKRLTSSRSRSRKRAVKRTTTQLWRIIRPLLLKEARRRIASQLVRKLESGSSQHTEVKQSSHFAILSKTLNGK